MENSASEAKRKFFLIDSDSDNYFVGVVYRTVDQVTPELWRLEVGETHWTSRTRGFERAA